MFVALWIWAVRSKARLPIPIPVSVSDAVSIRRVIKGLIVRKQLIDGMGFHGRIFLDGFETVGDAVAGGKTVLFGGEVQHSPAFHMHHRGAVQLIFVGCPEQGWVGVGIGGFGDGIIFVSLVWRMIWAIGHDLGIVVIVMISDHLN